METPKKSDLGVEKNLDYANGKLVSLEKDTVSKTSTSKENICEILKPLLPHVILENKIDKKIYAHTILRSPDKAKKLYEEFLQFITDYDIEYKKYLHEMVCNRITKENDTGKTKGKEMESDTCEQNRKYINPSISEETREK